MERREEPFVQQQPFLQTERQTSPIQQSQPKSQQQQPVSMRGQPEVFQGPLPQEIERAVSIPFPDVPVGGRLKLFQHEWFKISNDQEIRDMVSGMYISLELLPVQHTIPTPLNMGKEQKQAASEQIATLLSKKAIIPWKFNPATDFMNTVFLRPKKDHGWRMILDLKNFNANVSYKRFKMETLKNILDMVTPLCWMGSIDFCDAYLMTAILPNLSTCVLNGKDKSTVMWSFLSDYQKVQENLVNF